MQKKYEALNEQVNLTRTLMAKSVTYKYLNRTNLIRYSELSRLIGCEAFVKHENHNPTGSFKIRGRLISFITCPKKNWKRAFWLRPEATTVWPWPGRDNGFMCPVRLSYRK